MALGKYIITKPGNLSIIHTMKIGIDVSPIIYGTGVSTYTRNLVKNLLKLDKNNEYVLFGGSLRRRKELLKTSLRIAKGSKNCKVLIFPIPPTLADLIWNRLRFTTIEKLTGDLDVFHSSDWTQPPSLAKKVTTVHDLVPIKYPQLSHPKIVAVHKRRLELVLSEVNKIIVPSKASKDDLVEFGAKEANIVVIPEAPDSVFLKKENHSRRVLKKYQINGKYLLGVGINKRKNTKRIIKAYKKSNLEGYTLVLIGESSIDIKSSKGVKILGHVNLDDLPSLYRYAEVLVYPSFYEGFGLPILEAFASELPVVTSDRGSMKEVSGDAAILVDPESTKDLMLGIQKAIGQKDELISKGKSRLKDFSWEKNASDTLKVYKSLN